MLIPRAILFLLIRHCRQELSSRCSWEHFPNSFRTILSKGLILLLPRNRRIVGFINICWVSSKLLKEPKPDERKCVIWAIAMLLLWLTKTVNEFRFIKHGTLSVNPETKIIRHWHKRKLIKLRIEQAAQM